MTRDSDEPMGPARAAFLSRMAEMIKGIRHEVGALRRLSGKSVKEIAAEAGVSPSVVSNLTARTPLPDNIFERFNPTFNSIFAVVDALGGEISFKVKRNGQLLFPEPVDEEESVDSAVDTSGNTAEGGPGAGPAEVQAGPDVNDDPSTPPAQRTAPHPEPEQSGENRPLTTRLPELPPF